MSVELEAIEKLGEEVRCGFCKIDVILRGDPLDTSQKGVLNRVSSLESGVRAAATRRTAMGQMTMARMVLFQGLFATVAGGVFAIISAMIG